MINNYINKEFIKLNILKKINYKFYFINFNEMPKINSLNINLSNLDNNLLYLYIYFIEQLFLKKPKHKLGKSFFLPGGLKIQGVNLELNLNDNIYIINLLKYIFISNKGKKNKQNFFNNIISKKVFLTIILNDSLFYLYNESLLSILSIIHFNLHFNINNKILLYYYLRLLSLI